MALAAAPMTMESTLTAKCSQLFRLKQEKERLEKDLKRVNEEMQDLAYREIPEMMRLLGMTQYKREDGVLFYLTSYRRAKLRKEAEEDFKDWLRANGYADLIKEAIPYQTLTAWYGELEESGELPEGVDQYVQVDEGIYVGMRRAR